MSAPHRRGACPGLSAPMPTGDGLLVRLMPAEPLALDAFVGFCDAARRHGNGTIEISARGSLQVRGLTPRSAPLFAAAVAELEIAAHQGVAILAAPLDSTSAKFSTHGAARGSPPPQGGRGSHESKNLLTDPIEVAAELRRALDRAQLALSPKVSVVVDGTGRLHLDAVSADIRLRASEPDQPPQFYVGLGGDGVSATWLGSIVPDDAIDVILRLLTVIAAHGSAARAADILRAEDVRRFHSALEAWILPSTPPPERAPAEMIGLHPTRDGTYAVGIGLAFGHAHAGALGEIARIATAHGARAARSAPDRTLLLIGVAAPDAADLQVAAKRLGFVSRADDPRRCIAACPGAPACASGLIPARALAAALAPTIAARLTPGRGVSVHISGCPKGCAHPGPAALTLVGTERGCSIIRHGSARATPDSYVDPANLATAISQIAADACETAHG
jgi:precorrin-3B synthase